MAKSNQSVVVTQQMNLKYNDKDAKHPTLNPEYLYIVKKTVNTLVVEIGMKLTPQVVQNLIDDGINVTIQGD